ncbi:MAG: hypothetical protein QXV73_04900 [Candidatus Micrarchaeia archaeon]
MADKLFTIACVVARYFDVEEPDVNADTQELAMFIKNALKGKLPESKHCVQCGGILVKRITGGAERYHCKNCFSVFDIKTYKKKRRLYA